MVNLFAFPELLFQPVKAQSGLEKLSSSAIIVVMRRSWRFLSDSPDVLLHPSATGRELQELISKTADSTLTR